MPIRLRNYGKFEAGKEVQLGTLGIKPDAMNITHVNKLQAAKTNTRSGKTYSTNIKKWKPTTSNYEYDEPTAKNDGSNVLK